MCRVCLYSVRIVVATWFMASDAAVNIWSTLQRVVRFVRANANVSPENRKQRGGFVRRKLGKNIKADTRLSEMRSWFTTDFISAPCPTGPA